MTTATSESSSPSSSFALIPHDPSRALETIALEDLPDHADYDDRPGAGDGKQGRLGDLEQVVLGSDHDDEDETKRKYDGSNGDDDTTIIIAFASHVQRGGGGAARGSSGGSGRGGIVLSSDDAGAGQQQGGVGEDEKGIRNVRATTLAMACGLHGVRLYGDVFIGRRRRKTLCPRSAGDCSEWLSLTHTEVWMGCITPDLRPDILSSMLLRHLHDDDEDYNDDNNDGRNVVDRNEQEAAVVPAMPPPRWVRQASRESYRNRGSMEALARAMKLDVNTKSGDSSSLMATTTATISAAEERNSATTAWGITTSSTSVTDDDDAHLSSDEGARSGNGGSSDSEDDDDDPASERRRRVDHHHHPNDDDDDDEHDHDDGTKNIDTTSKKYSTTGTTFCLHCRRPASSPCAGCGGAYFCDPPRTCRVDEWSHQCFCPTWKVYTARREELSSASFPFRWHEQLVSRECQLSEGPYEEALRREWNVHGRGWWSTEGEGGWKFGRGGGARTVDVTRRITYEEGFGPLPKHHIPVQGRVDYKDIQTNHHHPPTPDNHKESKPRFNELGLLRLHSWEEYYQVRNLPLDSPVALLLTFPLTLYHAVERYGAVPLTVAGMLKRSLRVHVVGIEKELNFVDLFAEVGYLLPEEQEIEMVFVVREDVLPPQCANVSGRGGRESMKVELTANATLYIAIGTYAGGCGGDGNHDLDPNFDCGTGPPDMIVGMNAGLFAYSSWRTVVDYLDSNRGVVGVFTDYNEHSGTNCASLGGGDARDSLRVNPFRQPRAMPVYSMNLPQFCNGFLYVLNEQELE